MPHDFQQDEISVEFGVTTNHWIEYRRLIMSELKSLNDSVKELSEKIGSIDKRLAILETKAALVGAIAGGLAYAIPKLIEMFMK